MSRLGMHPVAGWATLLLAALPLAAGQAQTPHTRSQTSVVPRLPSDSSATRTATGRIRELKCRGKPGIAMSVHQDPSPRDARYVTMVLRYDPVKETRTLSYSGMGTVDNGRSIEFIPGSCTWGSGTYPDIPVEPRVVYFDLPRDAQAPLGARDTTSDVAAMYPDVTSLPRFMSDPDHYWVFFVDDLSNISISFGRYPLGGSLPPTGTSTIAGALPSDSGARHSATVRTAAAVGGAQSSDTGAGRSAPLRAPTTAGSVAGALPADTGARRSAASRTPTPTTRSDVPTAVAPQLRTARVYDVRTAPGPRGVILSFNATGAGGTSDFRGIPLLPNQTAGITVQFSRTRPTWSAQERFWSYPSGWGGVWAGPVKTARGDTPGFEAEPYANLEQGQRYHYLITVQPSDGSRPGQRTGAFTADIRHPLNGVFSK